jgi:hypothetical protein
VSVIGRVTLFEHFEDGFDDRPVVVDLVVESGVVRLIQAIKFSVFDHWLDVICSEHRSEIGPIIFFIGRHRCEPPEISTEDLPADLRVIWLGDCAAYVDDCAG